MVLLAGLSRALFLNEQGEFLHSLSEIWIWAARPGPTPTDPCRRFWRAYISALLKGLYLWDCVSDFHTVFPAGQIHSSRLDNSHSWLIGGGGRASPNVLTGWPIDHPVLRNGHPVIWLWPSSWKPCGSSFQAIIAYGMPFRKRHTYILWEKL